MAADPSTRNALNAWNNYWSTRRRPDEAQWHYRHQFLQHPTWASTVMGHMQLVMETERNHNIIHFVTLAWRSTFQRLLGNTRSGQIERARFYNPIDRNTIMERLSRRLETLGYAAPS